MQASENLTQFKRNVILSEFKRDLKELYKRIKYALKINPHNTFKGNARQYINQFELSLKIQNRLIKSWLELPQYTINDYINQKRMKRICKT